MAGDRDHQRQFNLEIDQFWYMTAYIAIVGIDQITSVMRQQHDVVVGLVI